MSVNYRWFPSSLERRFFATSIFIASLALIVTTAIADDGDVIKIENVEAITITSDGKHIVTVGSNGKVNWYDLKTGNLLTEVGATAVGGSRVRGDKAITPGGASVVIDSYWYTDSIVPPSIWNLSDGTRQRDFPNFGCLVLSDDGRFALGWKEKKKAVSRDLAVIDVASGRIISVLHGSLNQAFVVAAVSPDGQYVATGHHQGLVALWDLRSGLLVRQFADLDREISVIGFSPDGKRLVAGIESSSNFFESRPTYLWIYETSTGYLDQSFTAQSPINRNSRRPDYEGGPTSFAFSMDGHWLIVGHHYGPVIIWDVFSGNVAGHLSDYGNSNVGPVTQVGFSPDTHHAFANQRNGGARIWDIRGLFVRYLYGSELATAAAHSPLFAPKGEFETTEQFGERKAKAAAFESDQVTRLIDRLDRDLESRAKMIASKVAASVKEVPLKIQAVGSYDADRQVFPVTIEGITEIVSVPLEDAPNFKAEYAAAKVAAMKRLQHDLTRWEYFNVRIKLPSAKTSEYAFGRQESDQPSPKFTALSAPPKPLRSTPPPKKLR